jgi:hypothetical protein
VSEADHEVRAREFVDNILEINRQHGVDGAAAEIEYEAAVDSVARTFMSLREQAAEDPGDTTQLCLFGQRLAAGSQGHAGSGDDDQEQDAGDPHRV